LAAVVRIGISLELPTAFPVVNNDGLLTDNKARRIAANIAKLPEPTAD
jgi:hypothetical protein